MDLMNVIKNPKTTIVDVRTDFEYADGHIDGAVNIPLDEIPNRLQEFKNFGGPIVLYCRSGARSYSAANYLRSNGIDQVYDAGGIGNLSLLLMNAN
jgi:rhodanese-related sulfurtransferase